ncbi:MAG: hypothetical protein ABEI77_05870 [Halorientalis sp.]
MMSPLVESLLRRFGPFLIPVVVFGLGVVGYGLLWLYFDRFGND